jgi:hypothetical protein
MRRIFGEPDYGAGVECASTIAEDAVAFQTEIGLSADDTNKDDDIYLAKL